MNKELLENYISEGKSIRDIATITGKGATTIRYWLTQYNLLCHGKSGRKCSNKTHYTDDSLNDIFECFSCKQKFNREEFRIRKDRRSLSSYCKSCESKKSLTREHKTKVKCIEYMGNNCAGCGKQYHPACYDFHHLEPEHKDFAISKFKTKKFEELKVELDKCVLVCSICHNHAHRIMKKKQGYHNKINGNTELWQANRLRKLEFINQLSCQECGYDSNSQDLIIQFPDYLTPAERLKYKKYNKTHWDDEYKKLLKQSRVLCSNCHRIDHASY